MFVQLARLTEASSLGIMMAIRCHTNKKLPQLAVLLRKRNNNQGEDGVEKSYDILRCHPILFFENKEVVV